MAQSQNPKEINNPELSLNPNIPSAGSNASQAGVTDTTQAIQNDLDDLIKTTINDSAEKQKIDFTTNKSEVDKKDEKKKELMRQRKLPTLIIIFSIILIVLLSLCIGGYLFYTYIVYQRTGVVNATLASYMPWVESKYEYVVRNFQLQPLDKYTPQQVVTTSTNKDNSITRIIRDEEIDFLTKKKVLQQGVGLLYRDVANRYENYEELKNKIGQQGFFPNDIKSISSTDSFNNSIQKAIVSVESIRFAVALKYFSMIDSFITQLSSYASVNKQTVAEKLQMFVKRGEKDTNLYIQSCFLNGYEIGSSCNSVGDFYNYYKYIDTSLSEKDITLFLLTMDLISAKLENTDFPSLDISVRDINTLENAITVNLEINTFREDELKLTLDNGILNPHIYLMTTMINYLRESRYVLTPSIKINTLTVNNKRVRVGGQTVSVNSSSYNFRLPLQNEVEREISDFTDIIIDDE